ncbi:MAG: acyl-CoA dehydrogenase family protein [Chloroflexi bacterium]|nr:acyl-CoA dehydrogenase family protein [Chloroflexota bacterium]
MDYRFTDEEESFRQEIREFLRAELPAGEEQGEEQEGGSEKWEFARRFQKKLAAKGWLVPHWPKEYGGGAMGIMEQVVMREEMSYGRAPLLDIFGVNMLGPVLMLYGTDEQKKKHLPGISSAAVTWCQGYSEPQSGSDLASLQTKAVKDGDDYVINGQKIWTSNAHRADWMFLLARTDPKAPKHKGISFLLTPTDTPGFSTRPLINLAGQHGFNEVFFEDVRIPVSNLVAEENRGWYVGAALLDFERSGIGSSGASRRNLDDLVTYVKDGGRGKKEGGGSGNGAVKATVRHRLAELVIETDVGRYLSYRVASMQSKGEVPNYEASVAKGYLSELGQRVAGAGVNIMGLPGQVRPESKKWAALRGSFAMLYQVSMGMTIAGGTSEIQRNIIAQRGLGLPRG